MREMNPHEDVFHFLYRLSKCFFKSSFTVNEAASGQTVTRGVSRYVALALVAGEAELEDHGGAQEAEETDPGNIL